MNHARLMHTTFNRHFFGMNFDDPALRRGRRVTVRQWEQAVLFRHGAQVDTLGPGAHRRWGGGYTYRAVDMRPWVLQVPTQEIPMADGVNVKVTVAGRVAVVDPGVFVTAAQDPTAALYLAVQVAVRELIARTTVDQLLAARDNTGVQLAAGVRGVAELGLMLDQLELKDIVLPPDLKRAQAQVLVARAEGQAALERARGETAALRNLANAARLCADNPALLQLRLVQQLETSTGHTVVLAGSSFDAVTRR